MEMESIQILQTLGNKPLFLEKRMRKIVVIDVVPCMLLIILLVF